MGPRRVQRQPHHLAPSFRLVLVEKFVLYFHCCFVLPLPCLRSYLCCSTDELFFLFSLSGHYLMNYSMKRYLMRAHVEPLLLFKPWETVSASSSFWGLPPQLHSALCFFVSGQRPVQLSKGYREEILSQQVIPFLFFFRDVTV